MASHRHTLDQWNPAAAFFTWLLPGLGHWMLGHRRRAVILGGAILLLWLGGLLIGGIGVIDSRSHRAWFLGQAMVAPSLAVNQATAPNTPRVDYRPSYGRVNEQGILFTALAGLLNLLAIIDVVYRPDLSRPDAARAERG